MDLLVVGGSGLLGRELVRQGVGSGRRLGATFLNGGPDATVVDHGVTWTHLDIRHREAVVALVRGGRPRIVLNAAYRQSDWATTAEGGMNVAVAAAAVGARLVHVSSDAVFSGSSARYDETALPDPTTPYGAAKAAAETAIKGITPAAVVARTSLIVGAGESQHERQVRALAEGSATGVLFTDDVRCPVYVADLAAALLELADSAHSGVHHVAGSDALSRYELGVLVARRDGLDPAALRSGLRAGSGVPGPVAVRLDCTRTQARISTRLRGAHEFLMADPPTGYSG